MTKPPEDIEIAYRRGKEIAMDVLKGAQKAYDHDTALMVSFLAAVLSYLRGFTEAMAMSLPGNLGRDFLACLDKDTSDIAREGLRAARQRAPLPFDTRPLTKEQLELVKQAFPELAKLFETGGDR